MENQGVLPGQEGVILQRGGQELRLRKVNNRLTMCLRDRTLLPALTQQWTPQKTRDITPQANLSGNTIIEWQVSSLQLENVMAALRDHEAVIYASHVYELDLSPGSYVYLADQLTVQFTTALALVDIQTIAYTSGLLLTQPLEDDSNTYCFQVGPAARQNPLKIANQLKRNLQVLLAEPNIIMAIAPLYRPTDTRYGEQWHLYHRGGRNLATGSHVYAEKAWDVTRGSRSITIAVTDDGFDLSHPDLQGPG